MTAKTFKPSHINEVKLTKVKRLAKVGQWQVAIFLHPKFLPEVSIIHKDTCPGMLLASETISNNLLHTKPFPEFILHPDEIMDNFLDAILQYGNCPKCILYYNDDTKLFLKDLCDYLDINLEFTANMDELSRTFSLKFPSIVFDDLKPDMQRKLPVSADKCFYMQDDEFVELNCNLFSPSPDSDKEKSNNDGNDPSCFLDEYTLSQRESDWLTAFLDVIPDLQLFGLPYAIRTEIFERLVSNTIPKRLLKSKYKLLLPTFSEIGYKESSFVYHIKIYNAPLTTFEIKLAGAENLKCFSCFLRNFLCPDGNSDFDTILMQNGTSYSLGNKEDAIVLLGNTPLEKGSVFTYQLQKDNSHVPVKCEVLDIFKVNPLLKYPLVSEIIHSSDK